MQKKICCLLLCFTMLFSLISYAEIESVSWNAAESRITVSGTSGSDTVALLSYAESAAGEIDMLPDGDITGTVLHAAEITPRNGGYEYSFKIDPGEGVIRVAVDADGDSAALYCFSEKYAESIVDSIASGTAAEIKDILENPVNADILGIDTSFAPDDLSGVYSKLETTEFIGTAAQKLETLQNTYLKETFFLSAGTKAMEIAEKKNLFGRLGFSPEKIKYYTDMEADKKSVVVSRVSSADSLDEWINDFYTELALYCVSNLTYGYMEELLNEFDSVLKLDNWPLASGVSKIKVYKGISGQTYKTPSELDSALKSLSSTNSPETKPVSGGGSGGGSAPSYQKPVIDKTLTEVTDSDLQQGETEIIFDDTADYEWALDAINDLYGKGIISGSGDGKFMPGAAVTRAEILKMLVAAFNINAENKNEFTDVSETHWVYPYLEKSGNLALGDGTGSFNPDLNIRREDIAVLVLRAMGRENEVTENFTPFLDDKDISDYARDAVYMLKELKVVNGISNRFLPDSCATRAEAAVMIYRALDAKER